MIHLFLAIGVFVIMLVLLCVGVKAGLYVGRRHLAEHEEHKLEVVGVAEGAVFALLGLLIAFTFSGAYGRFEQRKLHIIEEANAYSTAYQRIDLVSQDKQKELREAVAQFLDVHLQLYNDFPHFTQVWQDIERANALQKRIWGLGVAACEVNTNKGLAQLIIPALNTLFEEAFAGIALSLNHPPLAIFLLLIGLAVLGAFLSGYSNAGGKVKRPIHTLCYILLTSVTIFIIINMEFPRVGAIRVSGFDVVLQEVRMNMLTNFSGGPS